MTKFVPLADHIYAAGSIAGLYREAGLADAQAETAAKAAELMRGTESHAILEECRQAWLAGFESGRRAYHGGEVPADARPLNPSPKMARTIQHAADLERFHATQGRAA